jgi:ABC-type nitrate/sulfonate/bicarbonate transport system substrate-binding protein
MIRTRFLAGAAAMAATPSTARAAAVTVTTQLLWIKNVEYAGFYIADAHGDFARGGIDSVLLPGGPNLASVEAIVASGRADVGIDDFEKVVDAGGRGADFVVVGSIYQRGVGGLLSLPKNPVRKPADLAGKRIGLPQGTKDYIDGIFRLNGMAPNYIEVPVGFDPQPLVEGACDAYMCYITAQPLDLAARNIPYVLASLADFGWIGYDGCLFVQRAWAKANRPTLVRYLRAVRAGWTANARDPKLGATLTVERYSGSLGLSVASQLAQNAAQIPLTESDQTRREGMLSMSKHAIATRVYATLRATGRTNLPDPDKLIDLSYLQDVAKGSYR